MTGLPAARDGAHPLRATLLVVLSACCFGSIGPLTIIALDHGATLQAVQTWRYAVSALVLTLIVRWSGRLSMPEEPGARDRSPVLRAWHHPRTLLVAGGGQALVATLALLALRFIPAATEAFLFYSYPVWVTVISAMQGVERLSGTRIAALLLAVGGIAAMVGAPAAGSLHPAGVALALTAALIYALYIPVLGRLQRDRHPLDVARAMSVGGAVCFATWSLVTGALTSPMDSTALGASVLEGVLTAAAFAGFLAGLAGLGAVRTSITSTVEPFWTTMLGVLLLAQPAGPGTLLGGASIMGAVVLLQRVAAAPAQSSTTHEGGRSGRPSS